MDKTNILLVFLVLFTVFVYVVFIIEGFEISNYNSNIHKTPDDKVAGAVPVNPEKLREQVNMFNEYMVNVSSIMNEVVFASRENKSRMIGKLDNAKNLLNNIPPLDISGIQTSKILSDNDFNKIHKKANTLNMIKHTIENSELLLFQPYETDLNTLSQYIITANTLIDIY